MAQIHLLIFISSSLVRRHTSFFTLYSKPKMPRLRKEKTNTDTSKTKTDWMKLTATQLRVICNQYSLYETGPKETLVQRLLHHFQPTITTNPTTGNTSNTVPQTSNTIPQTEGLQSEIAELRQIVMQLAAQSRSQQHAVFESEQHAPIENQSPSTAAFNITTATEQSIHINT